MSSPEEAFTECWHDCAPRVAAYAQRHVGPERAPDVVAETFAVAWRRWASFEEPRLPWLITAARHVMANERRALLRRHDLELRLRRLRDLVTHDAADAVLEREAALLALAQLSEEHREALLLIAWDGLTPAQAARVLGIKEPALRARVHRARRVLEGADQPASHRPKPTVRQPCTEESP